MRELTEKRQELDAKREALALVFEQAKVDGSSEQDFSKVKCLGEGLTTMAKVEKVRKMNEELNELFDQVQKMADAVNAQANLKRIGDAVGGGSGAPAPHPGGGGGGTQSQVQAKSIGRLFIESAAFKSFQKGTPQGPMAECDAELKTLMETGAGWAPETTRTGIVTGYPTRPAPHVADFIHQQPTTQSAIVYMEETTFTNNATETTEGSSYGEAALALTERSVTVRKISTFLPVTDEQLEDVAGLEAYVNNRLGLMIQQRLDSQILVGTGIMPSGLIGTENVSGIQTQALGGDTIADAALKLFVKIRDDGFAEPNVCFIRPSKWQTVALLKTADGIYIWGHPSENGPARLWGVPVVQTVAVTSTKLVAGDYATHAFLALRRGVSFQISNSHSTYFVEGKQAIRADMRAAVVHLRPKAFGNVTGL